MSNGWVPSSPCAPPTLYLPLSGGTMTGPLILAADPVQPLEAATKQYVDAKRRQIWVGLATTGSSTATCGSTSAGAGQTEIRLGIRLIDGSTLRPRPQKEAGGGILRVRRSFRIIWGFNRRPLTRR